MGRKDSLRRRKATRQPLRYFFIYCEGEKTERDYFEALERKYKKFGPIKLKIIPEREPRGIAKKAVDRVKSERVTKQERDSFDENDQVWAVFDYDDHTHYEDAIKTCEKGRVPVARSNPCFDLWLVLHLEEYDRAGRQNEVQKYLKTLRPEYDPDKNKSCDCDHLVKSVEEAEARAARQLARRDREGVPFGPPSTTVGHLTAAIRMAAQAAGRPSQR